MKKTLKPWYFLIAFGILLFAVFMNGSLLKGALLSLWSIIYPVAVGFILAFILNVPMVGFEKLFAKMTAKAKKQPNHTFITIVCLVLTLLSLLLVVLLAVLLVIPSMAESVTSLYNTILKKWPEWASILTKYDIDTTRISQWLESLDLQHLLGQLTSGAGNIISSTVGAVSSIVTSVVSFTLSLVIACYVLVSKKDLGRQATRLVHAFCPPKMAERLLHTAELTRTTFSRFLSGQCVEAAILGVLILIALGIFGIPYAPLIGLLTAVCAFIPYIGAFISCAIGALLVLLTAPEQTIWCIVIYLVVQFVENQFIYPHVVGSSVGMSPLWTLVAVLIGGNLMGILGMIFFIPVLAVLQELLREFTDAALQKRQAAAAAEESAAEETPPPENTP